MKVGVIAFPLDRPVRSGIDRYVHRLAQEFAAGPRRDEFVWIHGAPFPSGSPMAGSGEVILPEQGFSAALARRRWSRRNPEGLGVLWGPYFGVLPGPFRRVLTVHDLYQFTSHDRGFASTAKFRFTTKRMVRASDWILADSQASRAQVLEFFDFPAQRVVKVHLGVDPAPPADGPTRDNHRQTLRETLSIPLDSKVVLFVGSFTPRKDPLGLMRAFARIAQANPDAHLLFFGTGCQRVPNFLPLVGRVHGSPSLDDEFLDVCYGGADIFALPSKFEGFGLPALEAMARGLPAVLARGGALAEIGEGAALMVDPGDEPGLAQALERLLNDPAEVQALAAKGRERAAQFTWSACAQATLRVLDAASGGVPARE